MKTIIVTGGIGVGKSVVCNEFKRLGAFVIGGDKVGHNCLAPNGAAYAETVAEFGEVILNDDGTINRVKLGQIAFSSRETLDRLNEITHKHILKEIVDWIDNLAKECDTKMVVLEVPLFRAADIQRDAVISVIADDKVRIERVMQRSGVSRETVERIMSLQPTSEEYRGFADYCIENDGSVDDLWEKARNVYEILLKD